MGGDFESFKAALNRSILGVTFRKFKRKKSQFYQHRAHNSAITQKVCDWLYEYLLANKDLHVGKNLGDFKVKTSLTIRWNETGKILNVSAVDVSVYLEVGRLIVDELGSSGKSEKVKIDLFYSDIDLSSQNIRSTLPGIKNSMGEANFEYSEHDILAEGKEIAKLWNVKLVPTVILNDEKKLENPDEKTLRREIEGMFAPEIASTNPRFEFASAARASVGLLASILKP